MRNNNSQHLLSDYMYQVLFQPIFHVVIYLIYRTTPRGRYHYYFHFSDEETESEGLSFQGHTVCKWRHWDLSPESVVPKTSIYDDYALCISKDYDC